MTEGQRLRWWQEGEQEQAPQKLTAAPLLPADPVTVREEEHDHDRDTWAELEAEALRRSQQSVAEEAESVSFHLKKTTALARQRTASMAVLCLSLLYILPLLYLSASYLYGRTYEPHLAHVRPPISFPFMLLIMVPLLQKIKWLKEKETPVLRLTPQGMHIDSLRHRNHFLSWEEIATIRQKRLFHHQYLEISATRRRRYVLEERDLPITIEALACRIDVYKADLHV